MSGSGLTYYTHRALLEDELVSIFAAAPTNPTVAASARVREAYGKAGNSIQSPMKEIERRIPGEDDDCPVCCLYLNYQPHCYNN